MVDSALEKSPVKLHNNFMPNSRVTPTYKQLYVIYLSKETMANANVTPGMVTVTIPNRPTFSTEGSLNARGGLSGMSKLYAALNLQVGDEVTYNIISTNKLSVTSVTRIGGQQESLQPTAAQAPVEIPLRPQSVFKAKNLNHVHIEVFRPENLLNWQPKNEPDVYIAFGILQDYTQYRYCCATSAALNTKLGFTAETKPDAILISNDTDEYLVAEFKMLSSSFKLNHLRTDIDVLVVWQDDEENRELLPINVVCLEDIARLAAIEIINQVPE